MSDLISRQAAIDALGDAHFKNYGNAILVIKDLPSAEPVRHGKWMPREEGKVYPFWERYTCSECGEHSDDKRYCPNCGARMDEDD